MPRAAIMQPGRLNIHLHLRCEGQELIVPFVLCQGYRVLPRGDSTRHVLIDVTFAVELLAVLSPGMDGE